MNTGRVLVALHALFLLPTLAAAEQWTQPSAGGPPRLAVMGDPGRSSFSSATPAVLRDMGYRMCVVWSVPPADPVAQRLLPVLLVERQHFTKEQYGRLRAYVRQGGGLVLIGYAANWLDTNGNQRRDKAEPEIRSKSGSGGLVDIVGAERVGETFLLRELRPVLHDPLCEGVEAASWHNPSMRDSCNCVTLRATTGTVACGMVRRKHDWSTGAGQVDAGVHALVVRREAGRGRCVWVGWTGIVGATRKGNRAAGRLLRNAIAWTVRGANIATQPGDADTPESELWTPKPGRFAAAFDPAAPARSDNVQTMMCHYTGRWHKVFGPPAQFAQWLADHHVEIIRVNVAACSRALYPSDVAGVDEWATSKEYRDRTGRDMLADLIAELHSRGIKLCGDYNHFSDRYQPGRDLGLPRAVDKDGKRSDRYYCWLSPEFAQRTRELVTEMFTRYDIDRLVIEDDRMPLCFCERGLDAFKRFCEQRGVAYVDPRQIDAKAQPGLWRLFGRCRAERYYEQVVGPMCHIVHERRPGAKLGAWVGRWMQESRAGYSRLGLARFVDFEWHMAYVDPPRVADDVWSDLANVSRFGIEQGTAIRPKDTAEYTVRCLTAALESGSCVIGVYPEFIKTRQHPGYDGMAQAFARSEALWADRYERRLASVGDVVVLCSERSLLSRDRRVLLARAGLDVREVRLYDDGRRVSDLKPLIAGAGAVVAADDVMLTEDDLAELVRFVRAGAGLYVEPHALATRPEFMAGDIVERSVERSNTGAWLKRLGVALGEPVDVHWMSLRSDHPALSGVDASAAVFGLCRRMSAQNASLMSTIGRDAATQAPVLCAGALGRGRVVCFDGVGGSVWSEDLLPRLCRWLVRAEDIRVESRRAVGPRAVVTYANAGERGFEGTLGIALPAAAKAKQVTVGGKPASVERETAWGSTRCLYVPVAIAAHGRVEVSVTADRRLGPD